MSLSPEEDFSDHTTVPTPKINLDNEFVNSQQEKMNVYLRVRPLLPAEILRDPKMCICVEDDHLVRAVAPLDSAKFKSSAHDNSALGQIFRFTRTFGPEVDQIQFFEETMKTTLENFIQGQNELVFAYGTTGSGKTYTMQGKSGGLAQPGVIPLMTHLLFSSIKGKQVISPSFKPQKYSDVIKLSKADKEREDAAREKLLSQIDSESFDESKCSSAKSSVSSISTVFSDDSLDITTHSNLTDKEISSLESTLRMKNIARESVSNQSKDVLFSIWVSFVEIYNENTYDLLEPLSSNKRTHLSLNEDENKNIYVKGIREIHVTSSEEALKLFSLGKKNLRIASTKMNYQSSRSHCIFTLKIVRVPGVDSPLSTRVNRLSFCDLAGSERTGKTQNTGIRLKEAGKINTSLLVLGRCIEALRQQGPKDKNIVPYRDSKLTRLFSAYFTGKGKASMIINVSPASHIFDETLNVLKFSALAKQVISNDLSLKLLSQWNKEINQLTESWEKSCTRWSSFYKSGSQKDSINVISETSMEDAHDLDDSYDEVLQRDQLIEELLERVKTLMSKLEEVTKEKENLETQIRAQVCREFVENSDEVYNCYRKQLKDLEESEVIVNQQVHRELKSDVSKDADEEDNAEYSGEESDDEKGYTSAHEDTLPPVLPKVIEVSKSEIPEDKGGKETKLRELENIIKEKNVEINEMKEKYESEIASKDVELKECLKSLNSRAEELKDLKVEIEDMKNIIASKETKLKDFNSVLSLKEIELSFLKGDDGSKANGIKQYETELHIRDEEIIALKKQVESKSLDLIEKEKELENSKSNTNKKDSEITLLKKRLEDSGTVAPKEDELKESEIKDAELTELKRALAKLQEDVTSKEKKIEDYENIVSLKNKELYLLQEKIEDSEVVVSEPKNLKYEEIVKSKDESIAQLKKDVEDHKKSIFFKDKELEECRNNLNSKEKELSALKQKLEECEVIVPESSTLKEYKKSLNSKEAEIVRLKKKIAELETSVISKETLNQDLESTIQKGGDILVTKDSEICELQRQLSDFKNKNSRDGKTRDDNNIITSQGIEITDLNGKIEKLNKTVAAKDDLVKELQKKLKKAEEMLSSEHPEVLKLHQTVSSVERLESEGDHIKMHQKDSVKTEEMCLDDKKIEELQKKIASVGSEALNKAPEWQNVQYLTNLVQDLSKALGSQQAKLSAMDKKYNDLQEQVEDSKKIIQEFNQKFKEKEELLLKKGDEIKELQCRLEEEEKEFNKKLEQNESILEKNGIITELEHKLACKIAEEENLKQQHIVNKDQIEMLEQLVEVLQQTEFRSSSMISDLEKKVQELIGEMKEEEREREEAEERWRAAEKGKMKAEEGKKKAEEERRKAEEERKKAEEERKKAEEERRKAVEEKRKTEEERQRTEEEKGKSVKQKKMEKCEREIQTENYEPQKHEKEVQTEYSDHENCSVDSDDSGCKVVRRHHKKKFKHTTPEDVETCVKSHSEEESKREHSGEEVENSEVDKDSGKLSEDSDKCSKSVDSDVKHQKQVLVGDGLVSCLQRIEMIAAQNTVQLNSENRNYCKKLLSLSKALEDMRIKLAAAAESAISEKENWHRKSKSENVSFVPKQESISSNQDSLHLIETLQKIDYMSGESISKLSDANLRLVQQNKALSEQVRTSAVEVELVNQEIERKDQEYCKIQSYLRKKEARIVYLESEMAEAEKKLNALEVKSKKKLLEEQTQHGIEVEQVVALKRQAETDYRSLERKFKVALGSTEDSKQRKKQVRGKYRKGRKRASSEEDEDFEPSQKKRMVKRHAYFEDDDDTSTCSAEAQQSQSTETSSLLQRFQEFVVEKSPVLRAGAQRVATFLGPKSTTEDSNSSTVKKKKKLFNSAFAAPLITSPVQETVRKISPKKTVTKKFRSKKDPTK